MSRGSWERDPATGIPVARLLGADSPYVEDGLFKREFLPDCNVFCVRSFAAAANYQDAAYFENVVLADPQSPFHYHKVVVKDCSGRIIAVVRATHQNSAQHGGAAYRQMQRDAARVRATAQNSLHAF